MTARPLVLLLALATTATAAPAYDQPARVDHLRHALDALRALGTNARSALELELHGAIRTSCGASHATTPCMIDSARATCARKADANTCLAAADIILTNEHAETDLVDESTRMRLVRTSADYHAAVGAELWSRYALLAAELALAPPAPDPATQIDQFCANRDRKIHACEPGAKACIPSLPYQRCAAGLVWFVVNHPEPR